MLNCDFSDNISEWFKEIGASLPEDQNNSFNRCTTLHVCHVNEKPKLTKSIMLSQNKTNCITVINFVGYII